MDETVDLEFCKKLPKIELHAHLSGSISRSALHDIWLARKESQPNLDLADPNEALPTDGIDIKTFFPLFSNYIYRLINTIPAIRESTLRVLQDFEEDGVVYLELRTTPRAIPEYTISERQYVETVLSAIDEYTMNTGHKMKTNLILSVDRKHSYQQAVEIVNLATDLKNRGVVGVDLCGNPLITPIDHLGSAFLQAKDAGLKLTLHFAEHEASATGEELKMLLDLGPQRIGHVIHVSKHLQTRIAKDKVGLELCLSCNVKAGMITGTFSDHHFGLWRREHEYKRLALCTDDVGIFGSSLSNEYLLASQHFQLGKVELTEVAEDVIDLIFPREGGDEKETLQAAFKQFRGEMAIPRPTPSKPTNPLKGILKNKGQVHPKEAEYANSSTWIPNENIGWVAKDSFDLGDGQERQEESHRFFVPKN